VRAARFVLVVERQRYLILALWVGCCLAAVIARPGELLELVLIGTAAAAAWVGARSILDDWFMLSLSALSFLIPLQATWPVRAYQAIVLPPDTLVASLLSLPSLGLVVVCIAWLWRSHRRPPILLAGAGLVSIAGALMSSVASASVSSASANSWSGVGIPVVLALVAATTLSCREAWILLRVLVTAALVPVVVALAAYVLSFGVPFSVESLVAVKVALVRPHLIQDLTFGNIGHLAVFAMLLLPVALVLLAEETRASRRLLAAIASAGLFLVLVATLSRSAIVVSIVALALVSVAVFFSRTRRSVALLLVPLAVLAAVALTPLFRDSFSRLLPEVAELGRAIPSPAASPTATAIPSATITAAPSPVASSLTDDSAAQRVQAVRAGLAVYAAHQPWGVGTGQYAQYDEVNTAAHSLLVELLAENGLAGAVGFALIVAFVVGQAIKAFGERNRGDVFLLRIACLAGAASFLADGLFAGAPLALGPVDTWASLLWLFAGIASVDGASPTLGMPW
jgi:O-Antigen ligase